MKHASGEEEGKSIRALLVDPGAVGAGAVSKHHLSHKVRLKHKLQQPQAESGDKPLAEFCLPNSFGLFLGPKHMDFAKLVSVLIPTFLVPACRV